MKKCICFISLLLVFIIPTKICFAQENSGDITFFVGSDTHYKGDNGIERISTQISIADMNALPGNDYPASIGGKVNTPKFLAFCGDETNTGIQIEIDEFDADFGFKGEGLLNYPVYEGFGNHDSWGEDNKALRDYVATRNLTRDSVIEVSENGLHYGFEMAGIHFVQLNLYPGNDGDDDNFNNVGNKPYYALDFLEQYLDKYIGSSGIPVVLLQHYGWDDFSLNGWGNGGWWSDAEIEALYEVVKDYNIIGIFWGHSHTTDITTWKGIDVYNDGAMQDDSGAGEYMVVNISGDKMSVAVRDNGAWGETSVKKIVRPNPNGITFFAASDIHFGCTYAAEYSAANIDSMNSLPGKDYPVELGGIVDVPRGVIVSGDETQSDVPGEVAAYVADWGVNGEGRLDFPVFDTWGNHDGQNVRDMILSRNLERATNINVSDNGLHYSFDWDSVHFVTAGIWPGNERSGGLFNYDPFFSLDFLASDLAENVSNTGQPVVIYQHFGFGPHSLPPEEWWTQAEADAYYELIKDYNVIVIIHGHEHEYSFYQWNGIDIINLPHYDDVEETGFCAINIKGAEFKAAMYTTKYGWTDTFQKQIGLGSINWNLKPKVEIIEPVNLQYFSEGELISMQVTAFDEDDSIVSVDVYVNDMIIASLTQEPYDFIWNAEESGYYNIYAKASDGNGAITKSSIVTIAVGDKINMAPLATELSSSFVSSWENIEAITDMHDPVSSADKTGGAYGNWEGTASYNSWNWVQYSFSEEINLGRSEVYWWTDGGGIQIPYNTYLEYWDSQNEVWVECPKPIVNGVQLDNDNYGLDHSASVTYPSEGCEPDMYNITVFGEEILCSKIKLHFISKNAQGILEWKIFKAETDSENPSVPHNLSAYNVGSNSVNLKWDKSSDNVKLSSYYVYLDGVISDTTIANTTKLFDLLPETNYSFSISALDWFGNESSLSDPVSITTSGSSSSDDLDHSDFAQIFPNPSSNYFNIVTSDNEAYNLTVITLRGQVVLKKHFRGNCLIYPADIKDNGVYICKLEGVNKAMNLKLVKY